MSATPAEAPSGAPSLAAALRAIGVSGRIEARQGLVVIQTEAMIAASLAAPGRRREVLALAREHGFTHVAVELTPEPDGAGAPVLRP